MVTDADLRRRFPSFWSTHERVLNVRNRGFGYWIWKPFIIRELLRRRSSSLDAVIYLDAGFELNVTHQSTARLSDYADIVLSGTGRLAFRLDQHPEYVWSKEDVMSQADLPEVHRESAQLEATPILRVCQQSEEFLTEWLARCTADDYHFVSDSPSRLPNHPDFLAHRHDQSIFSALSKTEGTEAISDETYWAPNWDASGEPFPLWARRNRTRFLSGDRRLVAKVGRLAEKGTSRIVADIIQRRTRPNGTGIL
jgi:hypothetical protein